MNGLGTAFTTGLTAFVATNIDDIIILLLFFAQVDAKFRRRHIVFGQYLGFTLLILASLPGFFGGLLVPHEWIGLLGLLPIVIGITQLVNLRNELTQIQTVTSEFNDASSSNSTVSFFS
ncbi:MAG TPA: cadmium resistance transporter, partial [Coleofasciculaceae cyanobacterium]